MAKKKKKNSQEKNSSSSLIGSVVGSVITDLAGNKKFMETICGTYSDGSTRSLVDSIQGEVLSPKDKQKYMHKKKKKKKSKIKL